MKKILAGLLGLWLYVGVCHAQLMETGFGGGGHGGGGGGCSDANATAWAAAVVTAGGTVSGTQATNVCNLIVALKGHSLWTIQDRIWLHAAENEQQALIDIRNLGVATKVGSPVFTASQGYAGTNSVSDYIDTGFAGATGPNFTVNSGAMTSYVRTSSTFSSATIGVNESGAQTTILPATFSIISYDVNNNAFGAQSANVGTEQGIWTSSRTGASAVAVYHNGSATPFGTSTFSASAFNAPSIYNFYVLGINTNNSSVTSAASSQVAITAVSAGLSAANAAQLQTDFNAYMTALGTNVY